MSELVELEAVFCIHRTNEGDAAALQGTTLRVGEGELVCVLGPSGAGKSTLLRVIAGLQVPSAGEVKVFGREIGRLGAAARARLRHEHIGFLPQRSESALAPDLRVRECISLPLALRGSGRRERAVRTAELLEAVRLGARAEARPAELSGGERQRVALCVALAHRPRLLLADEPTGELDSDSAEAVRGLIAELARAHRAAAIVVSHDPATAGICDRAVRLRDGRVIEDRRDGQDSLVVGRGGWVRLPPELLARAGIGEHTRVEPGPGGLILTPLPGRPRREQEMAAEAGAPAGPGDGSPDGGRRHAGGSAAAAADWSAARIELNAVIRDRGHGAGRRRVIDTLTRELSGGRMLAVTGRSGAGKSTLLRLVAGLERPDGGELMIDGRPLSGLGAESLASLRRQRIGYMAQEPSPIAFLSAEENVVLSLRLRGWASADAGRRAAVVLVRLGLADRARQRVSRLSAGEVQRVALARALAGARGLLIVDEPSSRLDEASAATVGALLADAAASDRQTVVCATHDEQLIRRADEVLELG